jgi:hypothetical protein
VKRPSSTLQNGHDAIPCVARAASDASEVQEHSDLGVRDLSKQSLATGLISQA